MQNAFVPTSVLVRGIFALALTWLPAAALAQQSSGTAPRPHDHRLLLPPAPGFETPDGLKPKDEKDSKLELAPQIYLGTSQLRFDTNRKEIDPIPRVGIDARDPTAPNPNLPQEKPLSYFGFTLSTPTH